MSPLSIDSLRHLDRIGVVRLGAWAFVAVSFALLLEPAGVSHFSPYVVCHFPPGTPCTLVDYGVLNLLASFPAFLLRSGVLLVVGSERLARHLGEAHLPARRLVVVCALFVAAAAVFFYGLGLVKLLFVGAWHVERAFFAANVIGGFVTALGLWWLSGQSRLAP